MDKNLIRSEDRANIVVVGAVVVPRVAIGHMHDVVVGAEVAVVGRRPIPVFCHFCPAICRKQRVYS